MSLFRGLGRAAVKGDLNKNSLKIFIILLEQTLGYGKKSDNLTDKRLAYLSNVRIDRFRPALQVVLDQGLFDRKPAKRYQYRYTIGKYFLDKYYNKHGDKDFFTPALPKNGTDFQKTEAISEKERHTALDLNPSLSLPIIPLQTLLTQSFELMQQQTQLMTSLVQNQSQNQTQSFSAAEPACPPEPVPITASHTESAQNHSDSTPEKVLKAEQKQSVCGGDKINKSVDVAEGHQAVDTNATGAEIPAEIFPTKTLSKQIAASLPKQDHAECYALLATLKPQNQEEMLWAYNDLLEKDQIRTAMPLFRGLIKRARLNRINIPQQRYVSYPTPPPPPLDETFEDKAERERIQAEQERIEDDKGLRIMLVNNAKIAGTTPEKLAEKLCLTRLLPL